MATTYQVKKGDTLSKIAASQGVKLSDITGYKSGNPDLIYEGENVTINKPTTTSNNSFNGKDVTGMSTKDLSKEMASVYGETPTEDDGPTIDTYKSDYATNKTKRDEAFQKLQGITTETFNSEYETRKLGEKKKRIETIDGNIASLRAARDKDLNEVSMNPNLSASQMTGDQKKQADFYNSQINNLINERNSVAGEYNSELDEIDRIVQNASTDARNEYSYFDSLFGEASGKIDSYNKTLREELASEQEQSNFEKQLAQALTIAQMRADDSGGGGSSDSWQLVYDDFGNPLYWFNKKTREISYINAKDEGGNDNAGGGNSYDNLDAELENAGGSTSDFKWYNPLTWF